MAKNKPKLRPVDKSFPLNEFPKDFPFALGVEDLTESGLLIKIKEPEILNKEDVLKALGFDKSWISVN